MAKLKKKKRVVYPMRSLRLVAGDAETVLRGMEEKSVQCCVTSPPYWGLRAYKAGDGEIGMEPTPDAYVERLVAVFREVRRVLRDDGTLWLNLGDAYAGSGRGIGDTKTTNKGNPSSRDFHDAMVEQGAIGRAWTAAPAGYKQKDLIGLPWMVAFALRVDGWYLRSDIIWAKPNPMPESVTDRPTKAHEYVFLLSKSPRYFFDQDAVRESYSESTIQRLSQPTFDQQMGGAKDYANGTNGNRSARRALENLKAKQDLVGKRQYTRFNERWDQSEPRGDAGRNVRTVWTIATQPSPLPHFAAFPDKLARQCILAGSHMGDTVLDPFMGTGTTLWSAREEGRKGIGIDLSESYVEMARTVLRYGRKVAAKVYRP